MLFLAAMLALDIPEPLETALSRQSPAEEFVSGRLRVTEGEAAIEFSVDYDEAGEVSVTLLAPDESALSEAEAELWSSWQEEAEDATDEESEESPRFARYDPEALRAVIGEEARFAGEADGMLLFSFTPQGMISPKGEAEDAPAMVKHLTGTVAVDPTASHVAWVEFSAPESFKPNIAARIERFSLRTAYEDSGAGPRFSRMEMEVAGSALFRQFDQRAVIELIEAEFAPAD